MATGRAYRIKKSAVKAYGYVGPGAKKRALKRNGSVTHIAAINGRGAYGARRSGPLTKQYRAMRVGADAWQDSKRPSAARSARATMSGKSARSRRVEARSSLTAAKKKAFATKMRGLKKNGRGYRRNKARKSSVKFARPERRPRDLGRVAHARARWAEMTPAARAYERKKKAKAAKSRRRKAPKKATRKTTMARKVRRRKAGAKRSAPKRRVAKRRTVKRRRKAAKKTAAPKRKRRRAKAKKVTLKANRRRSRRRLKKNYGTSAGARKGWRTRKARKASPKKRRKSRRKASATAAPKRKRRRSTKRRVARKGKRKLSMKKSAVRARRARRAAKKGLKPNRRRRSSRRLKSNRKRRSSRRLSSNRKRRLSPNRKRRSSRRRLSSNRKRRSGRRMRRNGRKLFRKNGVGDTVMFIAKTGGIALAGLVGHKLATNLFTTQILNRIFGSPAVVVATTPTTTATVAPATSGLGGLALDPSYQKLIGSFLVAGLGIFATAKTVKDPTTRNTLMTGIAVSFMHTGFTALLAKFAPQYSDMLGASDGTAARLSAMYGYSGTSLQPRYQPINGMGEYFSSGVSGLGEYFSSGVSGLGEYFSSGVSGLGALPAYEASAGYGANPDLMEAAAGMGAMNATNTNHIDPHGDLDREMTIAEAAAGVGSLPSYEASAGYGSISSLPSTSTWIPGSSDGQLWAGTRSISAPQSASEMVPAGILQTDGGQGVFG